MKRLMLLLVAVIVFGCGQQKVAEPQYDCPKGLLPPPTDDELNRAYKGAPPQFKTLTEVLEDGKK